MIVQKINSFSNYKINYKQSNKQDVVIPKYGTQPNTDAKDNRNKKKKYIIAGSTAVVLLLLIIFRKKIASVFKSSSSKEPPNPTEAPKTPDLPNPPENVKTEEEPIPTDLSELYEKYKKLLKEQENKPQENDKEAIEKWTKQQAYTDKLKQALKDKKVPIDVCSYCLYPIGSKEYLCYLRGNCMLDPTLQLEAIDEFDKYKMREWINRDLGQSVISELCLLCVPTYKNGIKTDGKIVSKRFIDIAEKVTERDNEMRDAAYVMSTFGDYYKDMDKETILRYIKLMQKISYQQIDHFDFELKLAQTPFSNDPDVKKELDILKEATKDFPQVDRRFNR